jgi:hypothetical protein
MIVLAVPAEEPNHDTTSGAEPPSDSAAEIREPPHVAAGLPAMYQTTRFAVREMGIARGIKTLLNVNKKSGFDCQSCAWPSPDGDRQVAEFCENGAKAIADEATTKKLTPEFSANIRSVIFVRRPISGSDNRGD